MGSLRTLLGDRLTGGITAALTGYLLVVQLFAASLMCGMTVPVEAGSQFVLCQPSLFSADQTGSSEDSEHALGHECPCVVCPGNDLDLSLALAPGADLGPAFMTDQQVDVAVIDDVALPIDPARLGLAPSPRGPPTVSA